MTIVERVAGIAELPTLPEVMLRVQEVVSSGDGSAGALAKVVKQDPALTAKILKVANSVFYGAADRAISSIDKAVARIGFNEVRSITTAVSLVRQFQKKARLLDYQAFWRHSLCAALLARDMPQTPQRTMDPERLFLAGLLHDIGILIYDQYFHEEFQRIVTVCSEQMLPYASAETAMAGGDNHANVGAALLARWKIDSSVTDAVRFHHAPQQSDGPAAAEAIAAVEVVICNAEENPFEGRLLEPVTGLVERNFGTGVQADAIIRSREKADLILSSA